MLIPFYETPLAIANIRDEENNGKSNLGGDFYRLFTSR